MKVIGKNTITKGIHKLHSSGEEAAKKTAGRLKEKTCRKQMREPPPGCASLAGVKADALLKLQPSAKLEKPRRTGHTVDSPGAGIGQVPAGVIEDIEHVHS